MNREEFTQIESLARRESKKIKASSQPADKTSHKSIAERYAMASRRVLDLCIELRRLQEVTLDILDDYESVRRDYMGEMSPTDANNPDRLKDEIERKRLRIYPSSVSLAPSQRV